MFTYMTADGIPEFISIETVVCNGICDNLIVAVMFYGLYCYVFYIIDFTNGCFDFREFHTVSSDFNLAVTSAYDS